MEKWVAGEGKSGIERSLFPIVRKLMRFVSGILCVAFLASGDARGQVLPPQEATARVDAETPVQPAIKQERSDSGLFSGAGIGGPGMGGPGYKATWYAPRPVSNSQSDLGLVRQNLSGAYPIWREGSDTVLLMAGVRNTLFSTDAILPDTQRPFPDELWNINAGLMYIHKFENGWSGGLKTTLGSASDKPFQSVEEMNVSFFGFLQTPASNDRDSWRFSLFYSPVGDVAFPIPGIAYFWKPSDDLNVSIGLPFSVKWVPVEHLTLTLSYIPVTNINARATYRVKNGLEVYGGFEWLNDAYFLADRASQRDRFLAFEKQLVSGFRWEICPHAILDLNAGYAFDRYYGEGRNQFLNLRDRIDVRPGAFIGTSLIIKY